MLDPSDTPSGPPTAERPPCAAATGPGPRQKAGDFGPGAVGRSDPKAVKRCWPEFCELEARRVQLFLDGSPEALAQLPVLDQLMAFLAIGDEAGAKRYRKKLNR